MRMYYKLSKFKKMKKVLLLLLLTGFGFMVKAQYYPIKFGLKAGATHATLSGFSYSGKEFQMDYHTSFFAGVTVEVLFSETFSLQSGLSYVGKGGKGTFDIDLLGVNFAGSATIKLNYLELPVNVLLTIPSGDGSIVLGGGPYFGYGINANSDYEMTLNGIDVNDIDDENVEIEEEPLRFGQNGLSRIDYGVNITAGYRFWSGVSINAGYGLGLNPILNDPDDPETKVKNRHFSLGLGFSF